MKRVFVALLLTWALAPSCKKTESAAPPPSGKGGRGSLVFATDVLQVEAKRVNYIISAPGAIDAFEHVQVTARVAGAVDRVAFTEGQQVKKGDTLVVIDSARYQVMVSAAKAAVDKAAAAQKDSEAGVARREGASTAHPGLIPAEELETYKTRSVTAKADTAVATQNLREAQLNMRDAIVRAPMEGIIQTRSIETGQYVQPGYVMATLLRNDPMLLRFQVEPIDAPRLAPGMTAQFTMRESHRTYSAKITLVAGASDAATHLVPVTAQVIDEGHKYWLRPGSFCDVSVTIPADHDSPIIPRVAARATDHGYVAYVIDNGVARERVLMLGMSTSDGWVEVRGGIKAGDLLVVRGAEALADGAKVKTNKVTAESVTLNAVGTPSSQSTSSPAPSSQPAPVGSDPGPINPGFGKPPINPGAGAPSGALGPPPRPAKTPPTAGTGQAP